MTKTPYASSDRKIFEFLRDCRQRRESCALVTIIDLDVTGPRPRGAHMAVSSSGDRIGYLTSGCLEQAVAQDALSRIRDNRNGVVRYGEDSPYLDFQLPCGGSLTFYIHVNPGLELLDRCLGLMAQRTPFTLLFDPKQGRIEFDKENRTRSEGGILARRYLPPLRFVLVGAGPELDLTVRVAAAAGYQTTVFSPQAEQRNCCAQRLEDPLITDPWTAVVVLLHDHDREPELVRSALQGSAFYIGAMGSAGTHRRRLDRLRELGIDETSLSRIHGPIGLIPAARDPATLAISTVAEIIDCYRRHITAP